MTKIIESIKNRRSLYEMNKERILSVEEIKSIVDQANKHVPTAFHSQTNRTVVLFGEESDKFWEITLKALRKVVDDDAQFAKTEQKIRSFQAGYGTILYFIETDTVKKLEEEFPLYAHNFPIWANQTDGMMQLVVWSALEEHGLAANLQHYTELIEEDVKKTWELPESWKLSAQMPFGKATGKAGEKKYLDQEVRVKFIGK